jgi:hypothetical protein
VASLTILSCSGGGAFSEKEKDTQDVADSIRQESGFEALEIAAAGDTLADSDSTGDKQ